MTQNPPLAEAVRLVGLTCMARELRLSHQAIRKWQKAGRMPRTEWTGETNYSEKIAQLTGNQVTREQLLGKWPAPEPVVA